MTSIRLLVENEIAPGNTFNSTAAIANGKPVYIQEVGICDPNAPDGSFFAVQWGSGGSFETVWVFSGSGVHKFNYSKVGNGSKVFRLVRFNAQESGNRRMAFWIDGCTD